MEREDDRILLIGEVHEMTRVPLATLYTWRTRKRGPKGFIVGRRLVYRKSEVLAWLEQCEQAEASR